MWFNIFGGITMNEFAVTMSVESSDIKRIRMRLGLTQAEFAKLVNCTKRTIENWETKNQPIKGPIVTVLKLLELYPKAIDRLKIPMQTTPLRILYMHQNNICSIIDVDEKQKEVDVYNYVNDDIYKAFGKKIDIDYEDYELFLESRCFPKERDKIKIMLEMYNIPFYDPILIIEKTNGRMAEDDFWLKIERKRK